jgi:hypothetical protein
MNLRTWLAVVIAPVIGGLIYAWIGYVTVVGHVHGPAEPTFGGFFVLGGAFALLFELLALIPLYLGLRHWRRFDFVMFFFYGVALWFAGSLGVFSVLVGDGWNSSSATAASLLPVGAAVVLVFWLIVRKSNGAMP